MQASPRDLVQFAPCYTDILPLTRGKLDFHGSTFPPMAGRLSLSREHLPH